MSIIQAFLPQKLSSQRIQGQAVGALWKDGPVERDDALQHQRVGFALERRGLAQVQRARGVGRAVEVLGARVAEVDGMRVDGGAGVPFRLVVDDSCVGARRGDGVEGEADEVGVLAGGQAGCVSGDLLFG